jgi:hypothetical protein
MIPLSINNKTCFFTVSHITTEVNANFIYGICLNSHNYFLSKTTGLNDCEQLDTNPKLEKGLLNEICRVISEIENKFKKRPSIEIINNEIFGILGRMRNPGKW